MTRIYHRNITTKAKGRAIGMTEGGRVKIACSFPKELFDRIADKAFKEGIGFQEHVRQLCLLGFEKTKAKK